MSDVDFESVIVGGGVVGLSIARNLAKNGYETLVLEAQKTTGTETSSRNSGVIHAGIYYPENSLKAKLCVRGKHLLYDYVKSHHIQHKKIGKYIIGQSDEENALEIIRQKAYSNGVDDLQWLSSKELKNISELKAEYALLSPTTGIIDVHGLMSSLEGELNDHSGHVAFVSKFVQAELSNQNQSIWKVKVNSGNNSDSEESVFTCKNLINAAGLQASIVAHRIVDLKKSLIPEIHFVKGNYFSLNRPCPFDKLIYPVPVPGGLGTHLTIDLGGQAQFGPDVEYLKKSKFDDEFDFTNKNFDYRVNLEKRNEFYSDVSRWWPKLNIDNLIPGYSGIRPKLSSPKDSPKDFMILTPKENCLPGLIQLFGIESPGLTASLAIAEQIQKIVSETKT